MVKKEMKKGALVKGKAAATKKAMKHNVKVMEKAGYSKKRAVGTAYGEVGMEKMGRRHEKEGVKHEKAEKKERSAEKAAKRHLLSDNKDARKEIKEHSALAKRLTPGAKKRK